MSLQGAMSGGQFLAVDSRVQNDAHLSRQVKMFLCHRTVPMYLGNGRFLEVPQGEPAFIVGRLLLPCARDARQSLRLRHQTGFIFLAYNPCQCSSLVLRFHL